MSLLNKLDLKSQPRPCLAVWPLASQSSALWPWIFVIKCRHGTDLSRHWKNMK